MRCHSIVEASLWTWWILWYVFAACSFWQGVHKSLWPKDNLLAGMTHHHLPGGLFCFGKFWRSQRKDEVNLLLFLLQKNNFEISLAVLPFCFFSPWWLTVSLSVFVDSPGTSQSQLPVPSQYTSTPTHSSLKFWKTPEVSKMLCRTYAVIWTRCAMPWIKWTNIWGFDAQNHKRKGRFYLPLSF